MTNVNIEHRTSNIEHRTFNIERRIKKYGSTPIKLVENRSRAVRLRRTGVYRIAATGIGIAGSYTQRDRHCRVGTISREDSITPYMPEAIKR